MAMTFAPKSIVRTLVAVVGIIVVLVITLVVIAVVMQGALTAVLVVPCFPDRGRDQTPRGRYARPDHNHRVYDKDLQCEACKHVGHAAATCNLLAQALFLTKYMKYTLDDNAKVNLEAVWLDRWSSKLGTPSRSPHMVMQAYLDEVDITLKDLDAQMRCAGIAGLPTTHHSLR